MLVTMGDKMHMIAQEAAAFVLPAWAIVVGWVTSVGVAATIVWNFVSGKVDVKIDQRVDGIVDEEIDKLTAALEKRFEQLEARFREYELRQTGIAEDVAYIRGAIERGLHS